jgi:hypothetical protein
LTRGWFSTSLSSSIRSTSSSNVWSSMGTTRMSLWIGLVVNLNLFSPHSLRYTPAEGSFCLCFRSPLQLGHTF